MMGRLRVLFSSAFSNVTPLNLIALGRVIFAADGTCHFRATCVHVIVSGMFFNCDVSPARWA